ncbi:hypothetical protein [Embleya sp. NBC_00896]|uniref:hypothetical protein n=1 Tax=Embleya sp. NBC_00896 TaxID=2975961 RepID=UPI00386EA9B5|nr:hypothetical protein OG928_25530 [Embleya sp. NBC_00896]
MALTFGTLLSSQGTDASFGAESTAPSGRLTFSLFQFVLLLFLFRVSSLAHRFGRFAFLAFGVRRVSALSAFQTLADLATRFSPFAFYLRSSKLSFLRLPTFGWPSLADPFSRLPRLHMITRAVPAACEPRVLPRITPVLDASTLAGFCDNAESLSRKTIPSNKMAAQIKPPEFE